MKQESTLDVLKRIHTRVSFLNYEYANKDKKGFVTALLGLLKEINEASFRDKISENIDQEYGKIILEMLQNLGSKKNKDRIDELLKICDMHIKEYESTHKQTIKTGTEKTKKLLVKQKQGCKKTERDER